MYSALYSNWWNLIKAYLIQVLVGNVSVQIFLKREAFYNGVKSYLTNYSFGEPHALQCPYYFIITLAMCKYNVILPKEFA